MDRLSILKIFAHAKGYFGMNKGFTLLEVVVAITIFLVAFSVLIKMQVNNISKIKESFLRLDALEYAKVYREGLSNKSELKTINEFEIKESSKTIDFGVKEVNIQVIEKSTGKTILTLKTYEE